MLFVFHIKNCLSGGINLTMPGVPDWKGKSIAAGKSEVLRVNEHQLIAITGEIEKLVLGGQIKVQPDEAMAKDNLDFLRKLGSSVFNDMATVKKNSTSGKPLCLLLVTVVAAETDVLARLVGGFTSEKKGSTYYGKARKTEAFGDVEIFHLECGKGNANAGVSVSTAIMNINPDFTIMVGIAGGVKDVKIGDVVIAESVYNSESGKEKSGDFYARPGSFRLSRELAHLANQFRANFQHDRGDAGFTVYVAPIAAGEKVVADKKGVAAKRIQKHMGDSVAVEMEGYGFLNAIDMHDQPAVLIRGISDLLNKKDQNETENQKRSCENALTIAVDFFSNLRKVGYFGERHLHAKESTSKAPEKVEVRKVEVNSIDTETAALTLVQTRVGNVVNKNIPNLPPDGPLVVLHIVPVGPILSKTEYDLTIARNSWDIAPIISDGFTPFDSHDGLFTVFREGGTFGVKNPALSQFMFHRNGFIEAIDWLMLNKDPYPTEKLIPRFMVPEIIRVAESYFRLLNTYGIEGDYWVYLTLVGTKGFRIKHDSIFAAASQSSIPDNVFTVKVKVDSNSKLEMAAKLKYIFDRIWNASGYPACSLYDHDNKLRQM